MPNAIFEEDNDTDAEFDVIKKRRTEAKDTENAESKSEIASWLARHDFVPHAKAGEMRAIISALLIIAIALAIFVYAKGKREAVNLEETGNVYLETQR